MSKLRVGIVGFGRIGAEHANWIASSSAASVGAVLDPTPARADIARSRGLAIAASLEALLHDGSIDAILVSTPTSFHLEHAAAALRAGKHVMVEKPMTLDLDEARQLLAMSNGRVLSVFQNRRWDLDFLTVMHAIRQGTFGRVFNVESRIGQFASCVGRAAREWNPNWRNEKSFGGGGLYDWGSHLLDQMWQLMLPAKPVRLFAQLRGNLWTRDCDDLARVCIDFDDGATGVVEINTTTARPLPRWHIDGEVGSADSSFSLEFDTAEWARLTLQDSKAMKLITPAPAGLTESQIWDQFARACRGEGLPAVRVESVLPTMTLLDAARESARTGQVVPTDPRAFSGDYLS